MVQILGWLSAEAARASRWKRFRVCGDAMTPSGRTLMATTRSRRVSCARYTSPMPPAPIGLTISYGPRREPGVIGNDLFHRGPDAIGETVRVGDDRRAVQRLELPIAHEDLPVD